MRQATGWLGSLLFGGLYQRDGRGIESGLAGTLIIPTLALVPRLGLIGCFGINFVFILVILFLPFKRHARLEALGLYACEFGKWFFSTITWLHRLSHSSRFPFHAKNTPPHNAGR